MIEIKIFKTPIKIAPAFFGNVIGLWAIAAWFGIYRHPGRDIWLGVLVGFCAMFLVLFADVGHAVAHIFSARLAKAPMDEIQLTSGMPRTLYPDDQVSPSAHRMRAIGGPVFSAVGLALSLLLYFGLPDGSLGRELAGWSILGHGFIFSAILVPLPMVDGGTILKWTLVEKGREEAEADKALRRVNWVIGSLAATAGLALLVFKLWLAGLVALLIAGIAIAAAAGKIK